MKELKASFKNNNEMFILYAKLLNKFWSYFVSSESNDFDSFIPQLKLFLSAELTNKEKDILKGNNPVILPDDLIIKNETLGTIDYLRKQIDAADNINYWINWSKDILKSNESQTPINYKISGNLRLDMPTLQDLTTVGNNLDTNTSTPNDFTFFSE